MQVDRIVYRYLGALGGGFIGMMPVIVLGFASRASLWQAHLWFDVFGSSLLVGHLFGLAVVGGHELPLQIARSRMGRGILGVIGGSLGAVLMWLSYHVLFLANTAPDWRMIAAGTAVLSVPLMLAAIRGDQQAPWLVLWGAVLALTLLITGLHSVRHYLSAPLVDRGQALLYFDTMRDAYLAVPGLALALAIGTFAPVLWLRQRHPLT